MPFNVKLIADSENDAPTVVQPDITVTCDRTNMSASELGSTGSVTRTSGLSSYIVLVEQADHRPDRDSTVLDRNVNQAISSGASGITPPPTRPFASFRVVSFLLS